MDLNTFMAWFSGYSENIKRTPTTEQWKRIKSEISKLEAAPPAPRAAAAVQAAPAEPAPPPPKPKPTTKAQWKAQYQEALIARGLDPESAKDFTDTATVDLGMDPATVAHMDTANLIPN